MDPLRDHLHYQAFLEAGAELGARHVLAQLPDPEKSRAVERFGALCDMAEPLNLNVSLEFVSWTETPGLVEAARIVREVNRPNASILLDVLHFDRSCSDLAFLRALPPGWFRWIQLCDAPAVHPSGPEEAIYTARCERLVPGEGGIDIKSILACLPDGIVYSLEIPSDPSVTKVGFREYVRRALNETKMHLDDDRSSNRQFNQPARR